MDNYVPSQGVYRLEYIEWQVENDLAFKEKGLNLEQLIHHSRLDGYVELKQMLNNWFMNSEIEESDVMEYLFMKAHPELFESETTHSNLYQ